MIGAQLRDRVLIADTRTGEGRAEDMTVRAHVFTVDASNPTDPLRPGLMVQSLRVLIAPPSRPVDWNFDRVTVHGATYQQDGPPLERYAHGKLHHLTLQLKRTEG